MIGRLFLPLFMPVVLLLCWLLKSEDSSDAEMGFNTILVCASASLWTSALPPGLPPLLLLLLLLLLLVVPEGDIRGLEILLQFFRWKKFLRERKLLFFLGKTTNLFALALQKSSVNSVRVRMLVAKSGLFV